MTYADSIQFLYGLRWFGAKFGLENTRQLAALSGNPQDQLRFIHVAGTNGKGSTCAMLESIYRAVGLRVGLFTSPHLVSFRERLQINRQLISEADVVRLATELHPLLKQFPADHHPTFFEVITVMALKFFAEQKCDLVIWETGLGGRLDATNIVTPLASVITNIGLDHQQWLGDTIAKIAAEKAGIIKPNVPASTAANDPSALDVISRVAKENRAPLTHVTQPVAADLAPSLFGEHQRLNAALALATVAVLRDKVPVTPEQIHRGLSHVHWSGRLQLVVRPNGQRLLLDGAHNLDGAHVLHDALRHGALDAAAPLTLILGVLGDKDWSGMCRVLAPLAQRICLVAVGSERTVQPQELVPICHAANPQAEILVCDSLKDALAKSQSDPAIVIAGSLYLIGEAMELLGLSPVPAADEKALNNWQPATHSAKTL